MELEQVIAKIKAADVQCIGSTLAEIQAVEEKLQLQLPPAYKTMLQVYGKDPGHFFYHSSVETQVLEDIQEYGRDDYAAVVKEPCPPHFFFIFEHQGYSYYYLDLTESTENQSVYFLMHADENEHSRVGNLVEFFDSEVDRVIEVTTKINDAASVKYAQSSTSKHKRDESFIDRIKRWIWRRSLKSKMH